MTPKAPTRPTPAFGDRMGQTRTVGPLARLGDILAVSQTRHSFHITTRARAATGLPPQRTRRCPRPIRTPMATACPPSPNRGPGLATPAHPDGSHPDRCPSPPSHCPIHHRHCRLRPRSPPKPVRPPFGRKAIHEIPTAHVPAPNIAFRRRRLLRSGRFPPAPDPPLRPKGDWGALASRLRPPPCRRTGHARPGLRTIIPPP